MHVTFESIVQYATLDTLLSGLVSLVVWARIYRRQVNTQIFIEISARYAKLRSFPTGLWARPDPGQPLPERNVKLNLDVRIIAATNKNLGNMVAEGKFRQDLLDRLHVAKLELPPLRERIEDIPLLTIQILGELTKRLGRKLSLDEGAQQLLTEYSWPGNVRELQHFLERLVIFSDHDVVDRQAALKALGVDHVATSLQRNMSADVDDGHIRVPTGSPLIKRIGAAGEELTFANARAAFDRTYCEELLRKTNGNVTEAAKRSRTPRKTFERRLKKAGIKAAPFRIERLPSAQRVN